MTKRLLIFFLCLTLFFGCCTPALADIGSLDRALARWLDDANPVRFSASLQLMALLPFTDTTLAKLNGVLKHITVDASLTRDGEDSRTDAQIAVNGAALMDWTETLQSGAYAFTTSLLPNRVLTSAQASPMALLAAAGETDQAQASLENDAAETVESVNTSDATEAFIFLDAITELKGCYQALTEGIKEYTAEKRANYTVKGIGTGKWSYVARLTAEQSEALLPAMRTVLACGMDDTYRADVAQMTFAKGFVVALYQNVDKQDICVYMKGTVLYPDGSKRNLVWQWAFITNGLERKDTFKYEATKASGTRDTRTVSASCEQVGKSSDFSLVCKTETTLKRNKITDTAETTADLTGKKDAEGILALQGDVGQALAQTESGVTTQTSQNAAVDLRLTPQAEGNTLSGTVTVTNQLDKAVQCELVWTLDADAAGVAARIAAASETTEAAEPLEQAESGVTVDLSAAKTPAPTQTPTVTPTAEATDPPVSSLEQIAKDSSFQAAAGIVDSEPLATEAADYLVGSAPAGLTEFTVPDAETTVSLDGAMAATLQNLLTEAAQNLAGQLLRALASLSGDDNALLWDSMTETDVAAFNALLGTL